MTSQGSLRTAAGSEVVPVRERVQGVSVVICCHNSAQRLPTTLAHLIRQEVPPAVRWEVVVVDNASSDGTAAVAHDLWNSGLPAPLRVVHEPELGLTHARLRGISEAAYEFIAFVDDDNWLEAGWVAAALDVMRLHPEVGACWGLNEGVFEVEPPGWFSGLPYAIGDPGPTTSDAFGRAQPWGAGLVIRRSAFDAMWNAGFRFHLSDRKGTRLSSGGDSELCLALALSGWRWAVDRRLALKHYMPAGRITWEYYCRLAEAQGGSNAALDPYNPAFQVANPIRRGLRRRWWFQVLRTLLPFVAKYPREALPPWRALPVGHPQAYMVMATRGRIKTLLRERSDYSARFDAFESWSARAHVRPPLRDGGARVESVTTPQLTSRE